MRAIDRLLRNRPKAGGLSLLGKIRALFANGEQGWWYDPSDFNRYMNQFGTELVTNGDFSNGTTGWARYLNGTMAIVNGALNTVNTTGGFVTVTQLLQLAVGKTYKVSYSFTRVDTDGLVGISTGADGGSRYAESGRLTASTSGSFVFTAIAVNSYIGLGQAYSSVAGTTAIFDNITVKELTAYSTATLFQDSAGTTPVTAVEQPVGLQLDLSKGLVLGPQLVTNGDFSNGTTGWTAVRSTLSASSGALAVTGTGTFPGAFQAITTVAGRLYQVRFEVTSMGTATTIRFAPKNGTGDTGTSLALIDFTTIGVKTAYFSAISTTSTIFVLAEQNAIVNFTIDNVSVKELPGNHRFQTTSANRPVVSARVNLLTKTEDFDNAAWTKTGITVTANAITAPDGTTTADKIISNATVFSVHQVFQINIPIASGAVYIWKTYLKRSEYSWGIINAYDSGTGNRVCYFDLANGVIGTMALGCVGTITDVGNGWYLCTVTKTTGSSSGGMSVEFTNADNSPSFAGTIGSGIFIWGADLRPTNQGVGLPAYQRVNTSTDYDSTGFPVYIKPNGSNQFMQTNSINFTATDKMTVWQGVRKLSDQNIGSIAELSADVNANAGTFWVFAPNGGSQTNWNFRSRGTTGFPIATQSGKPAPDTAVLTGIGNISGDITQLRYNGVVAATDTTDQGTGNYGNYPVYFYTKGGTSLFLNGNDYGSIARGAASTAAQITAGETYINSKTKAY